MGVDPDKIDTPWQACRGSEYQKRIAHVSSETDRQVGLSFGYNRNEDDSHSMSPRQAIRFLLHVASRGGNLLLNVGPDASGNIPPVQRRCLEGMAQWMEAQGRIDGTRRVDAALVQPIGNEGGDEEIGKEWVRWLKRTNEVFAYVDFNSPEGQVKLSADWNTLDRTSAECQGRTIEVDEDGNVEIGNLTGPMPCCITFRLK